MSVLRTNEAKINKENPIHLAPLAKKNSLTENNMPFKFQKVLKETNTLSEHPDAALFSKFPKN